MLLHSLRFRFLIAIIGAGALVLASVATHGLPASFSGRLSLPSVPTSANHAADTISPSEVSPPTPHQASTPHAALTTPKVPERREAEVAPSPL